MEILKFSKKGCAPCATVSSLLKEANIPYTEIDIMDLTQTDLVLKYGIRNVPTTMLIEGEEVKRKVVGTGEIKELVEEYEA